uniref:Uncharacterized protein n=1 Tax=Meloidogyne enterolobii TaxID=390850 RepID=A0A6V7Y2W2_MELEN|nr:unnamed protein product [Meloidogyne enterolobii]
MANKFILVPEEIYKGLTTYDTGEPNLDFVRQGLEKTKLKRETPSAKNVHYNQELRRYLQLRNEQQNRPVKVEMVASPKGAIMNTTASLPASNIGEDDDNMWMSEDMSFSSYPKETPSYNIIPPILPDIKPTITLKPKTKKPTIPTYYKPSKRKQVDEIGTDKRRHLIDESYETKPIKKEIVDDGEDYRKREKKRQYLERKKAIREQKIPYTPQYYKEVSFVPPPPNPQGTKRSQSINIEEGKRKKIDELEQKKAELRRIKDDKRLENIRKKQKERELKRRDIGKLKIPLDQSAMLKARQEDDVRRRQKLKRKWQGPDESPLVVLKKVKPVTKKQSARAGREWMLRLIKAKRKEANESPAAFSGVDRLWKEARKVLKHIPKNVVQDYLEGHRTYTLMRPKRIHFNRALTIPAGFMTDVQVDLADFQAISRHNKGNKYLLLGIDVLSKRIFGVPVKSKTAENMVTAFNELIKQMPMKPHRIFSDKGKEFKNSQMNEFFQKEEIHKMEPTHSEVKASLAERAIRHIKQRIYRYFAQNKTLDWIQVLPKILEGINKAKSRVHGMRPVDVNFDNAQEVWEKIYGDVFSAKKTKPKLEKGDYVRMSLGKGVFEKGYIPNWGDEILQVENVKKHVYPIRYKVQDDKGEKFKGSFYGEELARVRKDADTEYRIEKVIKKKKRSDGTYDLLVKFIGYPEREWIHETQLV